MAKSNNDNQKSTSRQPAKRQVRTPRKQAATKANPPEKDPTPSSRRSTKKAPGKEPQPQQRQQPPQRQPSQPRQQTPPPPPAPPKAELKKEPAPPPQPEKPTIILDQSVAILVDGNNIEMSLHSVSGKKGAMINFDKLVPALMGNRALSRFIYFREGKSISSRLAERLQKMFHGSVVPCYKSADIPLSIKAVQVASKVDTIIILSGDADYVELVRHLKHDGIRVEIAAFPETTAEILRNESDYFFPITVEYSFVLK